MSRWFIFGLASFMIAVISWKSLNRPGSHGFYRSFAWEAILGLFLINVNFWFYRPLAWNQVIAWLLLTLSLIPLGFGIHSLRTRGKPAKRREGDPSLLAFEKTAILVTSGIYHYFRHPLYSSLFLLAWGIFFKSLSAPAIVLVVTATVFLIATAIADERECSMFFGAPYREYMQNTKRFIPYIF